MRVKMRKKGSSSVSGAILSSMPKWAPFYYLKGNVRAPDNWGQEEKILSYESKEIIFFKCSNIKDSTLISLNAVLKWCLI